MQVWKPHPASPSPPRKHVGMKAAPQPIAASQRTQGWPPPLHHASAGHRPVHRHDAEADGLRRELPSHAAMLRSMTRMFASLHGSMTGKFASQTVRLSVGTIGTTHWPIDHTVRLSAMPTHWQHACPMVL